MADTQMQAAGSANDDPQSFEDTPQGWARRWSVEFKAARNELERWWTTAEKIVKRFKGDKQGSSKRRDKRLNLLTSNIQTLRAMLYGKTPQVSVERRFQDSQDDLARVAGSILERMLNSDIEKPSDSYATAIQNALDDRLLVGLGNAKVRYAPKFEEQEAMPALHMHPITGKLSNEPFKDLIWDEPTEVAPAVPAQQVKSYECVETDYLYWKDQLWSPCRTEHDKRWHAFKTAMSRKELVDRFGEIGKLVPLNTKRDNKRGSLDQSSADPWSRSDVWEIWDKDSKRVSWYVEGFDRVLDQQDDPLGIDHFFPFPTPLYANLTTSGLIPVPDFQLAEDLYDKVDELETRISFLVKAIKVAGVYDSSAKGIQRLLEEASENQLIPVDNWAMFAEKGGIKGLTDWLPLETIVAALDKLTAQQDRAIAQLFQVTGMSDIMRGEANQQATATEQAIKAKFASIRVQSLQDEFARFASELQEIKAQIICAHYDPQTILDCSNVMMTPDAPMAIQAVQFLKENHWQYRIKVKPESVSLTDYAALKQERSEVIQTIAGYVQAVMPLAAQNPAFAPMTIALLQWLVAGVRGGSEVESILDQTAAALKQQAMEPKPPPPPDPKLQAQQMKTQGDLMKTHMDAQARQMEIAAETKSGLMLEAAKTHGSIMSAEAKERAKALHDVNVVTGGAANPGGIQQ
jgi:hypothetical protein